MADPEHREVRPDASAAGGSSSSDATSDDPGAGRHMPETWIGVYRVIRLLGTGGMGDVFLAFDSRLQRRVAIKRIRSDAQVSARARERLRREAAAAAALSHPAIVHVYDILTEESGESIVMEYVEGQTLAQARSRAPLPTRQAVRIARQVADGLAAAHAVGLIHRDLKTQNVIVTPSGQAKILDFGVAKRLWNAPDDEALTVEGSVPGTLRSMSPEQAQGRGLDERSDLFSLGVMLYEICTGRPPFEGATPAETLLKVVGQPPAPVAELRPDLPAPLAALIGQLLEKDPERRPASAAEVAARLRQMERLPSVRPFPSTRVVVVAVALLAVVAAVFGAFRFRRGSTPTRAVAVLVAEPSVASASPDERFSLAAFALREAILRALTGLEGIEPVGSGDLPGNALPLQATVRAVAADEVIQPVMDCRGPSCRVSLRRQRGGDEHVLGNSVAFDVSSEPEDSLALTKAVAIHLGEMFADHRPRSTSARLEVQSADYERYLSFRRRTEAGQVLTGADLDGLERLTQSSPDLTEAHLMAASTARVLRDRPRAARILQAAESRDPQDPRLAYERFLLEVETGSVAEAQAALAELERRAPGDARAWVARARLLTRQGKLPEAAEVRRRMLRERPSWKNLWYIADVEIKLADAKGAREHLRQLLQVSPGNPRGRSKMAELEWLLGDPAEAARIYEELLKEQENARTVGNLGWSLVLAGEYAAAVRAYGRALELQPDDLLSRLNLGIAHEGLGEADRARRLYQEVLDRLAPREGKAPLSLSERLQKAEALARLGRAVEAVELTMQALGEGDRDPQVLFQAAIIYALCHDQNHALVHAREARHRGLSPRWFGIPGFESLRAVPAFQELLTPG